jgi:hypothetical protein
MSCANGSQGGMEKIEATPGGYNVDHDAYGIDVRPAHELAWAAVTAVLRRHGGPMQRQIGDGRWTYSPLSTGLLPVGDTVSNGRVSAVRLRVDLPESDAPLTGTGRKGPAQRASTARALRAIATRQAGVGLECWQVAPGVRVDRDAPGTLYKEIRLTPKQDGSNLNSAKWLRVHATPRSVWPDRALLGTSTYVMLPPDAQRVSEGDAPTSALRTLYMDIAHLLQPLIADRSNGA